MDTEISYLSTELHR